MCNGMDADYTLVPNTTATTRLLLGGEAIAHEMYLTMPISPVILVGSISTSLDMRG